MQGKEVRQILTDHHVNLNQLAKDMGITPQALFSRFNAHTFRQEYLQQITAIIGKDIFDLGQDKDTRQPVLDLSIDPGHGTRLEDSSNKILEYVQIPAFNGCLGISIFGTSLAPSLVPGDVAFVRPFNRLDEVDYGCAYVLITRTDRLLKYIYPSDRGTGYYKLVSKDAAKYPAYDIDFSSILFLYKVVGLLRRSQL